MTKSVCCDHEKMFFIYNLFYINFLQVFSIKFSVNLSSRHLVYFSGTTMEIRVPRPFIVVIKVVTSMVTLIVLYHAYMYSLLK